MSQMANQHPETILFVGAGATQALAMPPTSEMANFLWNICDEDPLTVKTIEASAKCFENYGKVVVLMDFVLDGGAVTGTIDPTDERWKQAFPNVQKEDVEKLVQNLRRHYDWGALKLIAKAKKGDSREKKPRGDYLQEVFTLMDVCIRDGRGFEVDAEGGMVFLSLGRIRAAYETLILLINTMFACAWQKLINEDWGQELLAPYRKFFHSLALLMQKEAREFYRQGCDFNKRGFYQFSYSLVTTNFEPLFLWFIWNAHDQVNNHSAQVRLGNPGRMLKLLMNFPNSVGMRKPADKGKELSSDIWFPCTEAVAQNVNNPKYTDNRVFRLGKYFPVHGMSVMRHCPKCGRLNLYMGDTWDEDSKTLFPNGIIAPFKWGQEPRTEQEKIAHNRGEYDALECHFCGAMTHSYDNFMFMQTQLKQQAPSFIRESTDEALADITHAKHIVLLGYSMPLDDAIWGSLLSMMSRRKDGNRLYCSVVATFDPMGPKGWLYGKDLEDYLAAKGELVDDKEKVRAINNAITVFGRENVRAYVQGIPNVFGDGTESDVVDLLYPYNQPGWDIKAFTSRGVIRKVK